MPPLRPVVAAFLTTLTAHMADSKAHLLYVEDDESLSFVTRDNLELNGYQVT